MPDMQKAPKAKHTPGPWSVARHDSWAVTRGSYVVANARSPEDARLIAAAPEMYEALREMLAAHSMEGVYGADQSDIGGMKRRTAAKAAARAALAKAEGR